MSADSVQLLDAALLDRLSAAARTNPRLRQHHTLHTSPADPVQRFFNAIEPGSYVRPHQHALAHQQETVLMQRGRLGVLCFDAAGTLIARHVLQAGGSIQGIALAPGLWHSVLALETGSVFLEIKAGPYDPATAACFAAWAPAEGCEEARLLEQHWRGLFSPPATPLT